VSAHQSRQSTTRVIPPHPSAHHPRQFTLESSVTSEQAVVGQGNTLSYGWPRTRSSRATQQQHAAEHALSRAHGHAAEHTRTQHARSRACTQQSMHGSREGIAWRDGATRRRASSGPRRSPAAPRCCVILQRHLLGCSQRCVRVCVVPCREASLAPATVPKDIFVKEISTSCSGWPRPRAVPPLGVPTSPARCELNVLLRSTLVPPQRGETGETRTRSPVRIPISGSGVLGLGQGAGGTGRQGAVDKRGREAGSEQGLCAGGTAAEREKEARRQTTSSGTY
jgi:hypothetical protein